MNTKIGRFAVLAPLMLGGLSLSACDKVADACDLNCSAEGIAEGNASISGVASVDSFFGAVVAFEGKANVVADGIAAALAKIEGSLDGVAGADLQAKLEAKFAANVQGGVTIEYAAPKCEVSAKASIEATAKCDVSVEPGSVKAECSGTCSAEASATAECSGSAEMQCTATAPSIACSGECKGTCAVDVSAECSGTCKGDCTANGSTQTGIEGKCEGTCSGTCEATATGSCSGTCKGECTATAPMGGCTGGASVSCKAEANAKVECSGSCTGEVTPPKASAECEASVKANASVNAECTPPALKVDYQLSAAVAGDVTAKAEFEAWIEGFKGNFAGLVTALAQAKLVAGAGTSLSAAATGAVRGAVDAQLSGDLDIKATVGLGCALDELPKVAGIISAAAGRLQGQVTASASVVAAVGGA